MRIETIREKIENLFPDYTPQQILDLSIASKAIFDDNCIDNISKIINEYVSFDKISEEIFQLQVKKMIKNIDKGRKTIAIFMDEARFDELFNQIYSFLKSKTRFNYFFIVNLPLWNYNPDCDYENNSFCFIQKSNLKYLDFIELFICMGVEKKLFPYNSKSIALTHHMPEEPINDIKAFFKNFQKFVSFHTHIWLYFGFRNIDNEELFLDRFPKEIIGHSENLISFLPIGYPRFDLLYMYCKLNQEKDKSIIYALDTLGIHPYSIKEYSYVLIKTLLDNFPDYKIVLRPHPGDVLKKEVLDIVKQFSKNPMFFFNSKPSYNEVFAKSSLMITGRSGVRVNYSFSTENPVIIFDPIKKYSRFIETSYGYMVSTIEDLVERVNFVINNPNIKKTSIINDRNNMIANPGKSLDYAFKCFEHILDNDPLPEWKLYRIYDDNNEPQTVRFRKCINNLLKDNNLISLFHFSKEASHINKDEYVLLYRCFTMIWYYNWSCRTFVNNFDKYKHILNDFWDILNHLERYYLYFPENSEEKIVLTKIKDEFKKLNQEHINIIKQESKVELQNVSSSTNITDIMVDLKLEYFFLSTQQALNISLVAIVLFKKDIIDNISKLIKKSSSYEDLINQLTNKQLESITQTLDVNKKTVAIFFDQARFDDLFDEIWKGLEKEKNLNILFIIDIPYNYFHPNCKFLKHNFYFIPKKYFSKLNFIDLFLCMYVEKKVFPYNSKVIALVHHMPENKIENYSAFLESLFSVLSPYHTHYWSHIRFDKINNKDKFLDYYPKEVIAHSESKFTFLPIGNPKLDYFYNYCKKNTEKDKSIVYALVTLTLHPYSLEEYCVQIIETLLNRFIDYKVIFRPHPCNINHPDILKIIDRFSSNPRFIANLEPSYIELFARSSLLITTLSGIRVNYAYCTENPVISFEPNKTKSQYNDLSIGYEVYSLEQLYERVGFIVDNPGIKKDEIRHERDSVVANIGNSVNYAMKCIHSILQNEKLEDWEEFAIYDKTETLHQLDRFKRSINKLKNNNQVKSLYYLTQELSNISNDKIIELYKCLGMIQTFNHYCKAYGYKYDLFSKYLNNFYSILLNVESNFKSYNKDSEERIILDTIYDELDKIKYTDLVKLQNIYKLNNVNDQKTDNLLVSISLVNTGVQVYEQSLPQLALQIFNQAIKLTPNYEPAYYHTGIALYKLSIYDEAKEIIIQALTLKPERNESWVLLLKILRNSDIDLKTEGFIEKNFTYIYRDQDLLILFINLAVFLKKVQWIADIRNILDANNHYPEIKEILNNQYKEV